MRCVRFGAPLLPTTGSPFASWSPWIAWHAVHWAMKISPAAASLPGSGIAASACWSETHWSKSSGECATTTNFMYACDSPQNSLHCPS